MHVVDPDYRPGREPRSMQEYCDTVILDALRAAHPEDRFRPDKLASVMGLDLAVVESGMVRLVRRGLVASYRDKSGVLYAYIRQPEEL